MAPRAEWPDNGQILLANLLQSSRSTFSRGSCLSFFAFQEGILSTPISALRGWPTVSARFVDIAPVGLTACRGDSWRDTVENTPTIVCGHACGGLDGARHAPNDLPRRLSRL